MKSDLFQLFLEWNSIFEVIHYRGQVGFENSISYIIHTNEQGHNKAHLHAQYQEKEVVIEIPSGKIIAGNLRSAKNKQASQWVIKHASDLTDKWNELTSGIKIPVF